MEYISRTIKALGTIDPTRLAEAVLAVEDASKAGSTVWTCGCGGSALIASQLVTDLAYVASRKSRRIKAQCLSDNVGIVTAAVNDESPDRMFAAMLEAQAVQGDVLIAISGSGRSRSILACVKSALTRGLIVIALTRRGSLLADMTPLAVTVHEQHQGALEDAFFVVTHAIAYYLIESVD